MSIRFCSVVSVGAAAMLVVACENGPAQTAGPSPVSSSQSTGIGQPAQLAAKGGGVQHVVTMMDACDPETFNAALGAGSCSRPGGMRLATFLEQLGQHHSVGPWHFAPSEVTIAVGQSLVATNNGGETHTFTEVEEYGGGIVPQLNALTGVTAVAPECSALAPKDFIAPGASSTEVEEDPGVEKYQCCIHPWMRAQVRVSAK
jgi:plastocyanin